MIMKNYARFEEELTSQFKIDMRNLANFDLSTQTFQNLHFNGLLLTKAFFKLKKYGGVMFDGAED